MTCMFYDMRVMCQRFSLHSERVVNRLALMTYGLKLSLEA